MHWGQKHTSPTRPITPDPSHQRHNSFKPMWMQKLLNHSIFVRDESRCRTPEPIGDDDDISPWPSLPSGDQQKCPPSTKDKERPITSLPRQATFKRQNSERRERLCPVETPPQERRALSAARHVSTSSCVRKRRTLSSPVPTNPCRASAPAVASNIETVLSISEPIDKPQPAEEDEPPPRQIYNDSVFDYEDRSSRPLSRASSASWDDNDPIQLQHELDTTWILNLSMHFRDKSDREKFFVTYAETPTKWRRVTVSCDYRNAEPNSLEMDLKTLQFQRDKSFAIYEAIRESLPEIQFYETVTNLKLETSEGRLHVHVTEDVNEIIQYPARSMVRHILDDPSSARPMELCERDIAFDAHLSGFVYRVTHKDRTYIKKEIPSPDTIDEFMYEINALHALNYADNVIKLEAIILDDTRQLVKGLLISFAEQGAVVDILYERKGQMTWDVRELWAKQAVMGLRDIHEEGYVQGDFTLSNIVVDDNNNAKIIDINRRGCPVGWEPPEIAQKIASNQRISMYIGEKSDLYQLGMTLWALAMDDDEPERHDPPLMTDEFPSEVPEWFRNIVRICLAPQPRDRLSAKELVKLFPQSAQPSRDSSQQAEISPRPLPILRIEPKQYIDPNAAVERDDLERFKYEEELLYSPQSSKDDWTFTYPQSSQYDMESATSTFEKPRGRPLAPRAERETIEQRLSRPSTASEPQIIDVEPDDESKFDKVTLDGKPYLVRAGTFNSTEMRVLNDDEPPISCLKTMTLAPTRISKSPSPFTLPNWRRSVSESTPRNSKLRMLSQTATNSPDISPRSTLLALPERPRSVEPLTSARSSEETIPASVADTNFSGTTAFTFSTSGERVRQKATCDPIVTDPIGCTSNPVPLEQSDMNASVPNHEVGTAPEKDPELALPETITKPGPTNPGHPYVEITLSPDYAYVGNMAQGDRYIDMRL